MINTRHHRFPEYVEDDKLYKAGPIPHGGNQWQYQGGGFHGHEHPLPPTKKEKAIMEQKRKWGAEDNIEEGNRMIGNSYAGGPMGAMLGAGLLGGGLDIGNGYESPGIPVIGHIVGGVLGGVLGIVGGLGYAAAGHANVARGKTKQMINERFMHSPGQSTTRVHPSPKP